MHNLVFLFHHVYVCMYVGVGVCVCVYVSVSSCISIFTYVCNVKALHVSRGTFFSSSCDDHSKGLCPFQLIKVN